MRTDRRLLPLAAAAATLLAGGVARAGVTIVFQRGQQPPTTMSIDGAHMRMDGGEHGGAMVIDGPGKRRIVIDDVRRTYIVMTPEDMRRQRQRMAEARAQAEARLKAMPPEQRKNLEAMMGKKIPFGPMGGGKPSVIKYERMNARRTVAGFPCEMYRVLFDGTPRLEECVAPWGAGVVQKSDFAGLKPYLQEMAKASGGSGGDDLMAQMQRAPGFPIARIMLDEGGARGEEDQLKSVKRGAIPPATFEIPAGYTKTEMPTMGAPGTPGGPPRAGPFRPLPPPPQK